MAAVFVIWLLQMFVCLLGTLTTDRSMETFVPAGLLGMTLVCYLSGLAGILETGVWIGVFFCVLAGAASLILILSGRKRFCSARFFTPGFFVYLASVILFVYISYGRRVIAWDECSHWAISVKALIQTGKLYYVPGANIKFPSYPPGSAILHYIGQRIHSLFTGEQYAEWLLYVVYDMLCASFLVPALGYLKGKRPVSAALTAVSLFALPMCFFDEMYALLLIEMLLALSAFYAVLLFSYDRSGRPLCVALRSLSLIMLVLLKDSGLYFALVIPVLFLIADWIRGKKAFFTQGKFVPYLIHIGCALLTKAAWSAALSRNHTVIRWSDPIDFGVFFRVLAGKEAGYRAMVFSNYWKELLSPQIGLGPVSVSFLVVFIALLCFSALLAFFRKKTDRTHGVWYLFVPAIITALYLAGLLLVYMFKFEPQEAVALNSYPRYTKVSYIMWMLLLITDGAVLLTSRMKRGWLPLAVVTAAVLCAAVLKSNLVPLVTRQDVARTVSRQERYTECAKDILEGTGGSGRVYLVTQEHDGYEYHILSYLIYPMQTNPDGFSIGRLMVSDEFEEDVWTEQKTWEEWRDELAEGYGYVYVYSSNESLEEDFAPLFPSGVFEKTLYRVDTAEGALIPLK